MLYQVLNTGNEPSVLVVGDLMLDEHVHCAVTGISPEDDLACKLRVLNRSYSPGGAANVAANLCSLGAKVTLAGCIGNDECGTHLLSLLHGMEVVSVAVEDRPTTHKCRYITSHGRHVTRVDSESSEALPTASEDELLKRLAQDYDVVVLS